MIVGFRYGGRLSQYVFGDGGKQHQTVMYSKDAASGEDTITIDVYESSPDRREKLRMFLNSHEILKNLYAEEMFCEMHVWKQGDEESKQNMEKLFELYTGMNMSKEQMDEMIRKFESMSS